MDLTLDNIPSERAGEELAKRGVPPGTPITIIVGDDIPAIAARMREYARRRGMTPELFEKLMKDDA